MKWIATYTGSLIVLLLNLTSALACPFCESETGQQVKAGIFNDQFWTNVVLTLLPFPILLIIVALIYFDVRWPRRKHLPKGGQASAPASMPFAGD